MPIFEIEIDKVSSTAISTASVRLCQSEWELPGVRGSDQWWSQDFDPGGHDNFFGGAIYILDSGY
jgi:hypothetical protein